MLDACPHVTLIVDRQGKIAFANHCVVDVLRYQPDELVGMPVHVLVPDPVRDVHQAHVEAYFRNPVARALGSGRDLAAVRRDGTVFPVEISLSPLDTDEGPQVLVHLVDITVRKGLEAELLRQEKLGAIGRLTGGIAHDFNNLLTAISGYGELARAGLAPDHPVAADIGSLLDAAASASALTGQLLAFSRREAPKVEPVDWGALLRGIEPLLRRLIGETIVLRVETSTVPLSVLGDPEQLRQVVVNLALNARDAMPGGGTLSIRAAAAADGSSVGPSSRPWVRLTLSDTGTGIDSATRERIFEPFFTTKPAGLGTGLGLATVQAVVANAGGRIDVESEPGRGTTFDIFMPAVLEAVISEPAEATAPEDDATRAATGRETILLAEDESALRVVVRQILTRHGYRVVETADGMEAAAAAVAHDGTIDLLLTDVVMPGLDGRQLAARLRSERPSLRVVFMSGYDSNDDGDRLGGRPDRVIGKPFTPDELLRTVRDVLDRLDPTG
ncbi:MAG: hypothetical protein A2X23_08075 [Chloroflexi bacterium GWC2_73_18]|nr:MAG: hypothetical protein A2X23_08075 [Chloroflexi bacterium GWC2_73_18]